MRLRDSRCFVRVLWCGLLCCALATPGVVHAEIEVGLAQVDITPPIGGLTAGYSSAQPTDGVHDAVTARIMVLQSEDRCVALAVCDLCVYNSDWLYGQMESIGVDQLLLMNTHTHAGPKMDQDDFPSPDHPWRETVDQRILRGIQEAKANRFSGWFTATEGRIQLGYNRLVRRGDYAVTHFENPERIPYGPVDPWVGVIRVTDSEGQVRAVLVNYACHPVVLGPRNRKISADFPGVMRDVIEQQYGDDCMCLFVQGGCGDINPLFLARGDDRSRDFDVVEAMGRILADEVRRALSFIKDETGKSDSMRYASSTAAFRKRFEPGEEMELGAATLLINDEIAIVTMPGEPFHKFQVDLRDLSNAQHTFLFGYCGNGPYPWPRYLPDVVSAARGGYGASDATTAEVGAGERLLTTGIRQLFRLQGRLKDEPQRHIFKGSPDSL